MKSRTRLRKKEIANKGITLIALVITIIVLLILAGVSIATLTGQNGVLTKASTAKEEHLIEQYKEEINLIILDEIAERKTENKDELMKVSLDTKIREKEWINEIYKCNSSGEKQSTFEASTHLLVESKEHYEFLIEVEEEKQTAKIVSSQKEIETGKERLYLYKNGNEFEEITGGWTTKYNYGTQAPTWTNVNGTLYSGKNIGLKSNGDMIETNKPINLSGYRSINVNMQIIATDYNANSIYASVALNNKKTTRMGRLELYKMVVI